MLLWAYLYWYYAICVLCVCVCEPSLHSFGFIYLMSPYCRWNPTDNVFSSCGLQIRLFFYVQNILWWYTMCVSVCTFAGVHDSIARLLLSLSFQNSIGPIIANTHWHLQHTISLSFVSSIYYDNYKYLLMRFAYTNTHTLVTRIAAPEKKPSAFFCAWFCCCKNNVNKKI